MPLFRIGRHVIASRISPAKFIGPFVSMITLAMVLVMLLTGRIHLSSLDMDALAGQLGSEQDPLVTAVPVRLEPATPRIDDRIRIATFNVTLWDDSKAADPNVMQTLAAIISNFDLVAIQGIRSVRSQPIAQAIDLLNRNGNTYQSLVSEPIGGPTRMEQYAFVWDAKRLRNLPDTCYVIRDDADRMVREPFVSSFETRIQAAAGFVPFRFTVINANIDGREVDMAQTMAELTVLDDVFLRVREFEYRARGEQDIMLVGTLNTDARNLGELGQVPGILSLAGTQPTLTRGDGAVDHMLIDRTVTSEFTGRYGIVDFQRDYGLTLPQALMISEHRPVWAEFNASERAPQ